MATVVTNPTAGDVHVNVPLTNFSQKYLQNQDMFASLRAFPNLPVSKQSDLYYEFDRNDFFRDEATERADGDESNGGGFTLSTDPYFARVYAFHKDVTDRQRANEDAAGQQGTSATQYVTHKLLIRRERVFQQAYFQSGIWTHGNAAPTTLWSAASGDPIVDIRNAKRTVHLSTGYRPNKMLLGRQAYDTLLDNDAILDRITGGATTAMPAMVMRQRLAELLELDAIYVMDAIFTSTARGAATQTRAFIGGDNALLYYAPDSVGLNEPSAGVQFSWAGLMGNTPNGMRIKRFRQESREADRIEGQMSFDYKVTGADLGYFFTGVSS